MTNLEKFITKLERFMLRKRVRLVNQRQSKVAWFWKWKSDKNLSYANVNANVTLRYVTLHYETKPNVNPRPPSTHMNSEHLYMIFAFALKMWDNYKKKISLGVMIHWSRDLFFLAEGNFRLSFSFIVSTSALIIIVLLINLINYK